MRRAVPLLSGLALLAGGLVAAPLPAQAASTETMTHWSCDRWAKATVKVTWQGRSQAKIAWKLEDERSDGRAAALRIVALDWNGPKKTIKRNLFGGSGAALVTSGAGTSRSATVTFAPTGMKIDEIEAWIWTQAGSRRSSCGINVVKRVSDVLHPVRRTDPKGYASSKALRDRIVSTAYAQLRTGYREHGNNCSKYGDAFYDPDICQAWCADFAWWVWAKAGVPGAGLYNSSYTDDFADEWRVRFKPTGGARKPAKGDVVIWSHRTDGINGHVGVVVATDGWNVKIVQGNWSDRVTGSGWINPFTSRQDGGNKRVIGFASPA